MVKQKLGRNRSEIARRQLYSEKVEQVADLGRQQSGVAEDRVDRKSRHFVIAKDDPEPPCGDMIAHLPRRCVCKELITNYGDSALNCVSASVYQINALSP